MGRNTLPYQLDVFISTTAITVARVNIKAGTKRSFLVQTSSMEPQYTIRKHNHHLFDGRAGHPVSLYVPLAFMTGITHGLRIDPWCAMCRLCVCTGPTSLRCFTSVRKTGHPNSAWTLALPATSLWGGVDYLLPNKDPNEWGWYTLVKKSCQDY